MKGRISVICKNMLESDNFPKDFYDEHTHMMIGQTYELQANECINTKCNRAEMNDNENLVIKGSSAKTKFILLYPTQKFHCCGYHHSPPRNAIMLFGTKCGEGHAFALCSDCLFKLSLILLKYYKYAECYKYRANDTIRINKINSSSGCYLCRSNKGPYFRIRINAQNIVLCKSCLYDFIELILTSPTVELLFPTLHTEYLKAKVHKKRT